VGLEGICGGSYAITVPAKQKGLLSTRKDYSVNKGLEENVQQSQLTTYADITEVRTLTGATTCNQLLADGWVLLGVYPLTTVAEMTEGAAGNGQQQKKQDIQRYVRRLVGYVVGRRRE
jgi:hypothetical protein